MNLYDLDYSLWLEDQITNLRHRQWDSLDIDHLVEELEALNASNRRELYSYLVIVLAHLLKWEFQPSHRAGSWKGSIKNGRRRIARLFKDQPSLRPYLSEILLEAYQEACELAQDETGLQLFPFELPYGVEEILNLEFFPGQQSN
jgi:ribosomal protein L29